MADSLPVCNVLSEAIEYLTKLGTNIRIRSENLKDKRIRKDKLKNSHAVHKAVNKVLLICELSKKSIENVESGVKSLLLQLEQQGSSVEESIQTGESSANNVKFEYFTYESRKLKIRDKISLAHYTSVKVISTSMSLDMLEQYPVYHDCKLYRLRSKRKKLKNICSIESATRNCSSSEIQVSDQEENNTKNNETDTKDKTPGNSKSLSESENNEIETTEILAPPPNEDQVQNAAENNEIESIEMLESPSKKDQVENAPENNEIESIEILESPSKKDQVENAPENNEIESMEMLESPLDEDQVENVEEIDDNNTKNDCEIVSKKQNSTNIVKQQESEVEIVTLSSDEEKKEKDIATKSNKKKSKSNKEKIKHIKANDSSCSVTEVCKSTAEEEEDSKRASPAGLDSNDNVNSEESFTKPTESQADAKTSQSSEEIKPMIKCVSISKLLKPDVVDKLNIDNTESNTIKKIDKIKHTKKKHLRSDLRKETNLNDEKHKKLNVSVDDENDQVYWSHKRKEVKNFKPKKFQVKITRLPKITKTFLEKINLKRVTQMGSVLCELLTEIDEEKSNNIDSEPKSKKMKVSDTFRDKNLVDLCKVKTALLNDSDSDSDNLETCKLDGEKRKGNDNDSICGATNATENLINIQMNEAEMCNEKEDLVNKNKEMQDVNNQNLEGNKKNVSDSNDNNDSCEKGDLVSKNKEKQDVNNQNLEGNKKHVSDSNDNNDSCEKGDLVSKNKEMQDVNDQNIQENKKDLADCEKGDLVSKNKEMQDVNDQNIQENKKDLADCNDNDSSEKGDLVSKNKEMQDVNDQNIQGNKKNLADSNDNNDSSEKGDLVSKNNEMQDVNDQNIEGNKKNLADSNDDNDSSEKRDDNKESEVSEENELENSHCEKKIDQEKQKEVIGNSLEKSDCEGESLCNQKSKQNEVKTSLLHMSDDEVSNEDDSQMDTETCNNTHGTDKDTQKNADTNSNSETNSRTSVKEEQKRLSKTRKRKLSSKDTELVKSNLLQDSSDDTSKTPKKRKGESNSPSRSKRKHIMESMYAKKMLLTYSSSSDTDDEQLRSTLKQIKAALLTHMSSDEEDATKESNDSNKEDEKKHISVSNDNLSESGESKKEIVKQKHAKSDQLDNDTKDTSNKASTSGSVSDISKKSKMGPTSPTPGDSSSQNSDIEDAHDKEIDGLTNLKSLKKSHRRRRSSSSGSGRGRRMAKASGLISNEGFLEAESSSDVSLSASDHADNADSEDVPRVKLSELNGDNIAHLAKDDLLGESDTSVSHDEKRDFKKEVDTDDDNVKSKRRKVIAISSDSEVGSSRRKGNNFKLSDTDDSDDDTSEPARNKRKKKVVDSDGSGGSSSDGKKKRRRIKTLDDSDGSGSDTGNEGRNKHGRKNIRKVMSKNQLEEATKKAAREEKERIARITERQKLYNNLEFDESGKPDEVVLEKVVLDFDPETKEPLIQVDRGLVKKLKPHQANGIKFMWDACFESVKRIKKDKGSGCILAHCMGLGKTLQVVSLTHTLLTHGSLTGVNRVLVVCPLSTVLNWVNEFSMWLKHAEAGYEVDVYELSKFKQNSERAFQLSQWFEHGGVCVLGYEMFRNLSAEKGKKFKKKILKNFQESLVDPGPDLVVCDEGHLLKNEKTSLSQSMNRVRTRRRIVLTGTPLQNNLKEYYCMVQFVKPNLLGKYNEYLNRFVNPITNGQYTDSTEQDIRVMKRRSHVLHKMLDGAVQRRDYGVLAPFLPPKHEYVLFITLTDVQIKLYHHYLDNYSRRPQPGKSSGFLFPDFQSLQRIWTHPMVLKYNSERYEIMQQKKREREEEEDSEGSLIDFIDDDSTADESSTEESSDDLSDESDGSRKKSKKKKSGKKGKGKDSKVPARRGTRANPIEIDDDEPIETIEVKNENPTEWWMKLVNEEELEDMRNSHKLILLFDILRQCEAIGDKLLVFSQSLYSLDLIEYFLGKVDEATQAGRIDEKLAGHVGSWSVGVDYFRLDGSTSCENRSIWCKNFNRIDNQRARLFLISTRAGGLGINLVAANRVVIFDVSWNPSHDVQSIFRVYRFGQKKPCYVYRFLAMGTMEEKIYERQVTKQAISKRVIDEQQIDRHYAENDLAELYKFEPQPPVPRPLPPLPKDRLFAEMLKEHETQIYKYHEHDSLLENKEEETLSEEERRAAWEDFENEKTRPPPQPFLSPYAMHNGMVQGILAQQQQMAMAAISGMLRKNAPNMTDKQIRETVPLLLASNPGMFGGYDYGLIPSMSDMYKYPQPGMMNHPMMNPMSAGGDMSGGSGMGASALHYEPPWQRQQQQQQQMRLQQLMQHQNSMGAKYYAGGLGSRDPMAIALQQQRARELMHRPRQRGRPPLASPAVPRAPSAGAPSDSVGDVVNLDSD